MATEYWKGAQGEVTRDPDTKCPKCSTIMQRRDGKFGPFLFCPEQHKCGQKTITICKGADPVDMPRHYEPPASAVEGAMRSDPLYDAACGLEANLTGMAAVAYENERDHERTRNPGVVDGRDVLFGGGMFCDMGMEDDDEDIRPW